MTRSIFFSLALALGALGTGCGSGFSLRSPEGFVRVDGGDFDRRLTNADGVVLGVRAMDNDPRGNLRFWAGAIGARLGQRYTPAGTEDVRTRDGLSGVQLRYRAYGADGRPWVYWTTVFVDGGTVYVLEAAGDEEVFGPHEEAVTAAIASFRAG